MFLRLLGVFRGCRCRRRCGLCSDWFVGASTIGRHPSLPCPASTVNIRTRQAKLEYSFTSRKHKGATRSQPLTTKIMGSSSSKPAGGQSAHVWKAYVFSISSIDDRKSCSCDTLVLDLLVSHKKLSNRFRGALR